MRIICSKESLLKLLSIAENVISTKNSISILSNVLLEAKDNKLKIFACETSLMFFGEINAEVINEGSISVYCNRFYSLVRKMPSNEIEISLEEDDIIINPKDDNKILYKLKGVSADKYPNIKQEEPLEYFSIKQEIFTDMIKKTIFSIANPNNRKFVNGILFEKEDNLIKMVSSDGKRLSLIKKEIDIQNLDNFNIIIPPKILNEIVKLCNNNGDLSIAITNKNISIKINNLTFISNLLEANFPPYRNVIPNDYFNFFLVNKEKFFNSLDRISEIGDKDINKVMLSIESNELTVYNENIIYGSGKEVIPVELNGNPLQITLNLGYLIDFLHVVNSEYVVIYYKDFKNTIVIKEKDNEDYIYITMPITV